VEETEIGIETMIGNAVEAVEATTTARGTAIEIGTESGATTGGTTATETIKTVTGTGTTAEVTMARGV